MLDIQTIIVLCVIFYKEIHASACQSYLSVIVRSHDVLCPALSLCQEYSKMPYRSFMMSQAPVMCFSCWTRSRDMCNPRPAALFGAARVVLFMILKWYFKWIISLKFSCYSFHNHLPQAFALDQRFAAPEFHKQFVIVTLQPTAQIKLFVM